MRKYHKDGSAPAQGQIFVFGSNLSGIHGAGAARAAHQHYGAAWGVGEGMTGESYALPTVRHNIAGPLPLAEIADAIERFIVIAEESADEFFVTRVGCGLAGHRDEDIAPMFRDAPSNCSLPDTWQKYLGLSPEVAASIRRQQQAEVDHIQRRDRAWDDALAGLV